MNSASRSPPTSPPPDSTSHPPPAHEDIARRAYALVESLGRPAHPQLDPWLNAGDELRDERAAGSAATSDTLDPRGDAPPPASRRKHFAVAAMASR